MVKVATRPAENPVSTYYFLKGHYYSDDGDGN